MKKWLCILLAGVCALALCACSPAEYGGAADKWDCSVSCVEESGENTYVITYSNERVVSQKGALSFQNRNDFDIVVHLLATGEEEKRVEIPAGGVGVLYQIEEELEYMVGCHADVEENTEIKLMVYDGEKSEVY